MVQAATMALSLLTQAVDFMTESGIGPEGKKKALSRLVDCGE
jgi:hypothetical protein